MDSSKESVASGVRVQHSLIWNKKSMPQISQDQESTAAFEKEMSIFSKLQIVKEIQMSIQLDIFSKLNGSVLLKAVQKQSTLDNQTFILDASTAVTTRLNRW